MEIPLQYNARALGESRDVVQTFEKISQRDDKKESFVRNRKFKFNSCELFSDDFYRKILSESNITKMRFNLNAHDREKRRMMNQKKIENVKNDNEQPKIESENLEIKRRESRRSLKSNIESVREISVNNSPSQRPNVKTVSEDRNIDSDTPRNNKSLKLPGINEKLITDRIYGIVKYQFKQSYSDQLKRPVQKARNPELNDSYSNSSKNYKDFVGNSGYFSSSLNLGHFDA